MQPSWKALEWVPRACFSRRASFKARYLAQFPRQGTGLRAGKPVFFSWFYLSSCGTPEKPLNCTLLSHKEKVRDQMLGNPNTLWRQLCPAAQPPARIRQTALRAGAQLSFREPRISPAKLLPFLRGWNPAKRSPGTLTTHLAGEQCHRRVQERTGRRREQTGRKPTSRQ